MIPYYFPQTYLSQPVMQRLAVVFDRIGVCLPSDLEVPEQMRRWADSQTFELRIPVTADRDRLAGALKAFRSWASAQSGGIGIDATLLKTYHSFPPIIDAPFASQIRTDIEQRAESKAVEAPGKKAAPDPLFGARIFLNIAQQLDEQADSLHRDLTAVDARQQEMLRALQDEPAAVPDGDRRTGRRADEHELYMLTERMQAWAQLAAADAVRSGADAPSLFVAAGREALERILDRLPENEAVDRPGAFRMPAETSDPVANWRRSFLQALTLLATGQTDPAGTATALPAPPPAAENQAGLRIEVVRFPHRSITEVLAAAGLLAAVEPVKAAAVHTVIVTVEPA